MDDLVEKVYYKCLEVLNDETEPYNPVKELYDQFTYGEISNKIADIVNNMAFVLMVLFFMFL